MEPGVSGAKWLGEELLETRLIVRDIGADLAVGSVKQGLRGTGGTTVTRTHKEDGVLTVIGDKTVHVAEQEVDSGSGSPVAHQAVLDVDTPKVTLLPRFRIGPIGAHQRIRTKVDLANGQVVGATPILVNSGELLCAHRVLELVPRSADHGLSHGLFLPRKDGTPFPPFEYR